MASINSASIGVTLLDEDSEDETGSTPAQVGVTGICPLFRKKKLKNECKKCGNKPEAHSDWTTILQQGKLFKNIHEAARAGNLFAVKYFLSNTKVDSTDAYNNTALHIACEKGYYDCAEFLILTGASLKASDMANFRALHWAAAWGRKDCCELLLSHAAEVNIVDGSKNTPLHLAAENGHADVVGFLMGKTADANAVNSKKQTPLHLAALGGHVFACQTLVEHGADASKLDSNKKTARDVATGDAIGYLQGIQICPGGVCRLSDRPDGAGGGPGKVV